MRHNLRDAKGRFIKKDSIKKEGGEKQEQQWPKGYKAFNNDWTCLTKKYEVGKTYEEKGIKICDKGMMHYCEYPLDVLCYYSPIGYTGLESKFALVSSGVCPKSVRYNRDTKRGTNKLTVEKELNTDDLLSESIKYLKLNTTPANLGTKEILHTKEATNPRTSLKGDDVSVVGYNSLVESRIAIALGDTSGAISKKDHSLSYNEGSNSFSLSQGYSGVAITRGWNSLSKTTGYGSLSVSSTIAKSTGTGSISIVKGSRSVAESKGSSSVSIAAPAAAAAAKAKVYRPGSVAIAFSTSTAEALGPDTLALSKRRSVAEGKGAVAMVTNAKGKAKGGIGSILLFPKYKEKTLVGYADFMVDGTKVKADTWYSYVKGKLEEVEE